jgi:hypothetical protein
MKNISDSEIPSLYEIKMLCRILGSKILAPKKHVGVQGNVFYYNDPALIIANEIANPRVRQHLFTGPCRDTVDALSEFWHGEKWRSSTALTTPMVRVSQKNFYVKDFVMLEGTPPGDSIVRIKSFYLNAASTMDTPELMCIVWPVKVFCGQLFVDESSTRLVSTRSFLATWESFKPSIFPVQPSLGSEKSCTRFIVGIINNIQGRRYPGALILMEVHIDSRRRLNLILYARAIL